MLTSFGLLALLCAFSPKKVGGSPVPPAGLDACQLVLRLLICQCVLPVRCISLAISECVQAKCTSGTFAGLLYSERGRTPCSRPSTEQSRVRESLSGPQRDPLLPAGFPLLLFLPFSSPTIHRTLQNNLRHATIAHYSSLSFQPGFHLTFPPDFLRGAHAALRPGWSTQDGEKTVQDRISSL